MKKSILLILVLLVATLMAAPSNYTIAKLPAGSTPAIDGSITEWVDGYFIDSLRSTDNVFSMDQPPWTAAKFQIRVYAAWDDLNVYFAMKVMTDAVNLVCGSNTAYISGCDNMKVNPGGQASAFYVYSNNLVFRNPSNAWQVNADLFAAANSTGGNNGLPSYEFSVSRAVLDQFDLQNFQLMVGSEDEDAAGGANETFCGVGVSKPGTTKPFDQSWDNSLYYPSWTLSPTEGPALNSAVEGKVTRLSSEKLVASPNPFMPTTNLVCNVNNNGMLKIYDVSGKVVNSFVTKAGVNKIQWNGTDLSGKSLSSGIYIARVVSGNKVLDQRLFLTR